jgi:DNA-binding HxlR family transcriptional regulator
MSAYGRACGDWGKMETDYRVLVGGIAETLGGLRQLMPTSRGSPYAALRELASDGIVQRQPKGAIPAPVEYSLADYGRSLMPLVEEIRHWRRSHLERLNLRTDAS